MQRLKGMHLLSIHNGEEGAVSLKFDHCILAAYNPWSAVPTIQQLIGRTVEHVHVSAEELSVRLTGDARFSVSLRGADYSGPEAFSAHFEGGQIVAQ